MRYLEVDHASRAAIGCGDLLQEGRLLGLPELRVGQDRLQIQRCGGMKNES